MVPWVLVVVKRPHGNHKVFSRQSTCTYMEVHGGLEVVKFWPILILNYHSIYDGFIVGSKLPNKWNNSGLRLQTSFVMNLCNILVIP